jgi:AAA+ superfamily predicted ATPase
MAVDTMRKWVVVDTTSNGYSLGEEVVITEVRSEGRVVMCKSLTSGRKQMMKFEWLRDPADIPQSMVTGSLIRAGLDLPGLTGRVTYGGTTPLSSRLVPPPPRKIRVKKKPQAKTGTDVTLDKVILPSDQKEQIKAALSQIGKEDILFDKWGFGEVFEKGTAVSLLFYGTPGTGKTLTAQLISEELGAELKVYGAAEIQSSEPGGAERMIQQIFREAKKLLDTGKKQRVILFDECDSLLYDRNKVGVILGAQINALLTAIEHHTGIIIFTTNRLGTLDPALERRIAAKVEFPFPDQEQREAIWGKLLPKKAPLNQDVDVPGLASYPIAGGNIKNAILNAARMTLYKEEATIRMERFVEAIEKEMEAVTKFTKPKDLYETGDSGYHIGAGSGANKLEIARKSVIGLDSGKKEHA